MNIDFENTGTQIVFQTVRGLLTLAGMSGIIVAFIEGGTGTFFESFDRLEQAADLLQGIAS
ncbi:MAG: hypothetical protein KDJ26_02065 [Alphaproteobacteria bacterium]|jgi:hypothetical protein|nr:hypothetical protein [Alphaproteobacteria bacterium]MCB1550766.1 hypothetical protein [Alphaproteobacteria bacterium]MCB9984393.1 hypothetical protein [Micavibrio sp.]HRK97841.1 hypothetical protein [Alphaproteobacteria bacterium]